MQGTTGHRRREATPREAVLGTAGVSLGVLGALALGMGVAVWRRRGSDA